MTLLNFASPQFLVKSKESLNFSLISLEQVVGWTSVGELKFFHSKDTPLTLWTSVSDSQAATLYQWTDADASGMLDMSLFIGKKFLNK